MVRNSNTDYSSNSSNCQPAFYQNEPKQPWSDKTLMPPPSVIPPPHSYAQSSQSSLKSPFNNSRHPDARYPKLRIEAPELDPEYQNVLLQSLEDDRRKHLHDRTFEYNSHQATHYRDELYGTYMYVDKGGVSKNSKKSSNAPEYRETQGHAEIDGRDGNAPEEIPQNTNPPANFSRYSHYL